MRIASAVLALSLVAFVTAPATDAVEPLTAAHAHNDYWHPRPLLDALGAGFSSVEADVFLRDGRLLVGHDPHELKPDRTLESLYLRPLQARIQQNGGSVYPAAQRFLLFIDIKADRDAVRGRLLELLLKYRDMVTSEGGRLPAVRVVLSGQAPRDALTHDGTTLAGGDGRLSDLDSDTPADDLPLISDRWTSHFTWRGDGPFPPDERKRLEAIVQAAHAKGRLVRFWATPENERVWAELLDTGVDLINTDKLERLAAFLRARGSTSGERGGHKQDSLLSDRPDAE